MRNFEIGRSSLGLPIPGFLFGRDRPSVVIVGGMHGDEIEGIRLAHLLIKSLRKDGEPKWVAAQAAVAIVPILNPDGHALASRWTANDVDLNRNFPTADWSARAHIDRYPPGPRAGSETETQSLVAYLKEANPAAVVDLHSYKESVLMPTWAPRHGSLKPLLANLASQLQIRIEEDTLGYPVHGGLHTWCQENQMTHFTYEVLRDVPQSNVESVYLKPTLQFLFEMAIALKGIHP